MVKHKQFDGDEGKIIISSSPTKMEFFCFRCNMRKTHKIRGFWYTKEGMKLICGPCYEDISKKRDKKARIAKKRRTKTEEEEKPSEVLCPLLLEALEKDCSTEEFLSCMKQFISDEKSGHYFQTFQDILRKQIGYSFEGKHSSTMNLDDLQLLVKGTMNSFKSFSEENQKILQSIMTETETLVGKT